MIKLYRKYCCAGDDIPSMKDLKRYIVKQQSSLWKRIGQELGLNECDIDLISKKYKNKSNCCTAMLEQWLREIPSPTWGQLDDAIMSVEKGNSWFSSVHYVYYK